MYSSKIFEYFQDVVLKTYTATPPLAIEEGLATTFILESAIKRGLLILFEYRPRIKSFSAPVDGEGNIVLDATFRDTYKVYSINDIYSVIPYNAGFISLFPFLMTTTPKGNLYYLGIFDFSQLISILSAVRTFYIGLGMEPKWGVYLGPDGDYVITIRPVNPEFSSALLLVKVNPVEEYDINTDTLGKVGITGMELELLTKYIRGVFYYALGRLRARFGNEIPLGVQTIRQDGEALLGEAKEYEQKFIDELIAISPAPLPTWG